MKKTIYTLAFTALLLAGCSQEESLPTGEAVQMTFTANLSTGMQSRADGEANGISVDKLICAVFMQNGESLEGNELIRDTVDVNPETGKATFTPTLLKGYKYGIVFWAYKDGTSFYNTENLSNITFTPHADSESSVDVTTKGLVAYTKTIKNITTSSEGGNITLTRPLAQVNVATTERDWENVTTMGGGTPTTATVTLTGCSNTYNALTGTYSGDETFTYTIKLDKDQQLDETDKILLGTGYTFPGSTVNCKISVINDSEVEIYNVTIPSLPTDGNHRTNIIPGTKTEGEGDDAEEVGGLMTGSVSYEVTIDEGYTDNHNKTPEELEKENSEQ